MHRSLNYPAGILRERADTKTASGANKGERLRRGGYLFFSVARRSAAIAADNGGDVDDNDGGGYNALADLTNKSN